MVSLQRGLLEQFQTETALKRMHRKFNFEAFFSPPLPALPKSALPALPKSDAGDELLAPLLPLPLLLLVVPKSPPAQHRNAQETSDIFASICLRCWTTIHQIQLRTNLALTAWAGAKRWRPNPTTQRRYDSASTALFCNWRCARWFDLWLCWHIVLFALVCSMATIFMYIYIYIFIYIYVCVLLLCYKLL